MKKNKKIFIVIIIFSNLLLLISCKNSNNHIKSYDYFEVLKSFKPEFVNHFPRTEKKSHMELIENGEYDATKLLLQKKLSINSFERLYDSIRNITSETYMADDTCLFVVNMFTTKINYTKERKASKEELKILDKKCLLNKKPVANFWGLYDDANTRCKLPEDFELFILDAKNGIFWDEKYLTDGQYMPDKWQHGYSKGIAMNKKSLEVIYWFVIW